MSKTHSAFDLAKKVKEMRDTQRAYFGLRKISNQTKQKADAERAAAVLIRSKMFEKGVDQMADEILLAGEEEKV